MQSTVPARTFAELEKTQVIYNFPEEIMSGRPELNRRIKRCAVQTLLIAVALLTLSLGSRTVNAQILYGSVAGTVADKTGALIPNASITLTSQDTGATRTTNSTGTGMYAFLNVLPGKYTVSVAKAGNFGGFAQKNIAIEANQ